MGQSLFCTEVGQCLPAGLLSPPQPLQAQDHASTWSGFFLPSRVQ